jgi:DNA-directed RNA polymerase subunit RPC12/RpoP
MAVDAIVCAACSSPVPREFWNREEGVRCRGCSQNVRVSVFPAVDRTVAGVAPEALRGETEASCFYHSQSRAAKVCDQCGRFLCALCDLEVEGRHICPGCFESGISAHKIETAEPRRVMYDNIAVALATLPFLLIWPAIVGAPWSLVIVFTRWNAPSSVVPRTKIRFLIAAVFALAELGFIVFVIYMMSQVNLKGRR